MRSVFGNMSARSGSILSKLSKLSKISTLPHLSTLRLSFPDHTKHSILHHPKRSVSAHALKTNQHALNHESIDLSPPLLASSFLKFYPIIYTGEIGRISDYSSRLITLHPSQENIIREQPNLLLYKYGTSSDVCRRIKEHNRQFKYFDIKILKGTIRHLEVEQKITRELKQKNLLYKMMLKGRVKREILCFTEEWQKEWFVCLVDDLIRDQYVNQVRIDMLSHEW